MLKIVIRPDGKENIRTKCGVAYDMHLADHIGLHPSQISRVLSGKHLPGNTFIAGVIDCCGLKFAFEHIFQIVSADQ